MKCEVVFFTNDLHGFFQLGPFDAEVGVWDGAVLREIAHGTKRSGELVPMGDLQEPGVKRGVVANGQIRLPAKFRHIRVLNKVQGIHIAALLPPFFNDVAGEAVNADCRGIVWLYGKVETVELFLDIEVPVSAVSPCPHVKGGKTENGVPAGGQTVGFDVEYNEPDSHSLAI